MTDYTVRWVRELACNLLDLADGYEEQQRELEELREYKRLYTELLDNSIKHSHKMVGGMLDVLLTPGVSEALASVKKE